MNDDCVVCEDGTCLDCKEFEANVRLLALAPKLSTIHNKAQRLLARERLRKKYPWYK